MKKNKKIQIILIVVAVLMLVSTNLLAATIGTDSIKNDKSLGDADTKMETIGSKIFTAISNTGIVISVVVLAVIGIRYMLGSVDERAEYKKSMMPYVIGAFLVFGASTIGKIVYTIFSNM